MNNLNLGTSVTLKEAFEFNHGFFIKEFEPGIVCGKETGDSVPVIFREISGCFANAKILIPVESLEIGE